MTDYTIIGYRELESEGTNNLFDAVDIIKRLVEKGLKVAVVSGSLTDSEEFVQRVNRLFR